MYKILILIVAAFIVNAADWGYSGSNGPETWKMHHQHCGGNRQSPINILTFGLEHDSNLAKFKFTGYNTATSYNMRLRNNGHTAQVDLIGKADKTDLPTLSEGGLVGTYRAKQFHFHWGSDDSKGSEHQIDSKASPLEMHIVHYNDKYPDLLTAADKVDGLSVLSVLFKSGAEHTGLKQVTDQLPKILSKGNISIGSFELEDLFSGRFDKSRFYRYEGSLTTPACQETVTWTVFADKQTVSPAQLEAFRALNSAPGSDTTNNFRPIQALNLREVTMSFDINQAEKLHKGMMFIFLPLSVVVWGLLQC